MSQLTDLVYDIDVRHVQVYFRSTLIERRRYVYVGVSDDVAARIADHQAVFSDITGLKYWESPSEEVGRQAEGILLEQYRNHNLLDGGDTGGPGSAKYIYVFFHNGRKSSLTAKLQAPARVR